MFVGYVGTAFVQLNSPDEPISYIRTHVMIHLSPRWGLFVLGYLLLYTFRPAGAIDCMFTTCYTPFAPLGLVRSGVSAAIHLSHRWGLFVLGYLLLYTFRTAGACSFWGICCYTPFAPLVLKKSRFGDHSYNVRTARGAWLLL